MFNVIIATHGQLAQEFLRVLKSFFGEITEIEAISLGDKGISDFSKKVDELVIPLVDKPVIVLCDITGGTPFNEFAKKSTIWQNEFELFGGVSLPVLVETLNLRMQNKTLPEVVEKIKELKPLTRFEIKSVMKTEDE